MTLDLLLAALHHLLAFALAGIIAAELATVRPGLGAAAIRRLAILDAHYGLVAVLIIGVGILRVFYGVKGPDAYLASITFWSKMGAFAVVGVLSAAPTIRIIGWRRRVAQDPAYTLPPEEVGRVRPFIVAQAAIFPLIPILAAAMARGVGL